MSTGTAPPKGSMRLYRSIEPPLDAGSYRLTVGSSTTKKQGGPAVGSTQLRRHFDIEAPRFSMAATEVAGVFPPRNARGTFDDTLAHLALGRRTLPYERVHVESDPPRIPWLVLLVFAESEPFELKANVPLSTIVPASVYQALAPPGDVVCDAVEVPLDLLFGLMPSRDELRLLTHVRQVNVEDRELSAGDSDGWFAVVVSNRVLEAGTRYRACLVSVEGRTDVVPQQSPAPAPTEAYDVAQDIRATLPRFFEAPSIDLSAKQALVLLHSWQFECEGQASFYELAQRLDVAMLGTPRNGRPTVTDTGHLPIRVRDRAGIEERSWYRGPLVPQRLTRDSLGPYHSADQARRVDPLTGAEDISYAAAFELGRLIAMSDARLAQELALWRRGAYARAGQIETGDAMASSLWPQLPQEFFERFEEGILSALAIGALAQLRPGVGPIVDPFGIDVVASAVGLQPDALMEAWNLSSLSDAGRLLGVRGAGALGGDVGTIGRTDRGAGLPLDDLTVLTETASRLEGARDALIEPSVEHVSSEFGVGRDDLGAQPFERPPGGIR